jgi:hypothetical protein
VGAATAVLQAEFNEARPIIMRWSVVTSALRDLVRARANIDLSWVEVAQVASRWVDDLRTKGFSMSPDAASMPSTSVAELEPGWVARHGLRALATALGIALIVLGAFLPFGSSPATDMVTRAVPFLPPALVLHIAGWWQVASGVCLLVPALVRAARVLLAVQIPALLLPFIVAPDLCFGHGSPLSADGASLVWKLVALCAGIVSATPPAMPPRPRQG